jgi:hypothetical protein
MPNPQDSAHAIFDIPEPAAQRGPGGQQSTRLTGVHGLTMNGVEPSHAEQLRHSAGIVAVCLRDHRRKCRPHLSRLHEHGIQSGLGQPPGDPFRERPCFQPDARGALGQLQQQPGYRSRIAGHPGSSTNSPSSSMTQTAVIQGKTSSATYMFIAASYVEATTIQT